MSLWTCPNCNATYSTGLGNLPVECCGNKAPRINSLPILSKIDDQWYKNPNIILLTKEEAIILSEYLRNEYLTQHEPARSLLLKIHQFAESK